ncbi:MAG: hypothetical protein KF771_09165 [Burkholderiales bacterium]|nr:hypothetical protein [Burkholderiales bacterium]
MAEPAWPENIEAASLGPQAQKNIVIPLFYLMNTGSNRCRFCSAAPHDGMGTNNAAGICISGRSFQRKFNLHLPQQSAHAVEPERGQHHRHQR